MATKIVGSMLARKLALKALNESHRDTPAARRLFKQWLRENDDLLEAVSGPAIDLIIREAVGRDVRVERRDVVLGSRAKPLVGHGVRVGGDPRPVTACLPQPSAEADSRRAARLVHHLGLHAYPLPVTGKLLGEAQAWEIRDGAEYHWARSKGDAAKAMFLGFVFQAHPDRDKPQSEQRRASEVIDLDTLRVLDERAQIEAQSAVLPPLGGRAS